MSVGFKRAAIVAAALLVAGGASAWWWQTQARKAPQYLQLPDGTEAFFLGDSQVTPAPGYPQPREIAIGVKLLNSEGSNQQRQAWTRYCQVLLCSNEFIYID